MKYRAICPVCQKRLSRWWCVRTIPGWHHLCPACGAAIKSNWLWEWTGNVLVSTPAGVVIALAVVGVVTWFFAIVFSAAWFLAAVFVWPYVTKYDPIVCDESNENGRDVLSKRKRIIKGLIIALLIGYFAIYISLSLCGRYEMRMSGKNRWLLGGLASFDVYEWQPRYLRMDFYTDVRGRIRLRESNVFGLVYCPLIAVDRVVWHKTRKVDFIWEIREELIKLPRDAVNGDLAGDKN